jgi:hypothetical protein
MLIVYFPILVTIRISRVFRIEIQERICIAFVVD